MVNVSTRHTIKVKLWCNVVDGKWLKMWSWWLCMFIMRKTETRCLRGKSEPVFLVPFFLLGKRKRWIGWMCKERFFITLLVLKKGGWSKGLCNMLCKTNRVCFVVKLLSFKLLCGTEDVRPGSKGNIFFWVFIFEMWIALCSAEKWV